MMTFITMYLLLGLAVAIGAIGSMYSENEGVPVPNIDATYRDLFITAIVAWPILLAGIAYDCRDVYEKRNK